MLVKKTVAAVVGQMCRDEQQPSVAGYGALQASSLIAAYSSLAANHHQATPPAPPPSSQQRIHPYSDEQSVSTTTVTGSADSQSAAAEFRPDVPWEFPREKLYIRQKIGEGSFGEVWRAKVDGILGRSGQLLVAVKMLHGQ